MCVIIKINTKPINKQQQTERRSTQNHQTTRTKIIKCGIIVNIIIAVATQHDSSYNKAQNANANSESLIATNYDETGRGREGERGADGKSSPPTNLTQFSLSCSSLALSGRAETVWGEVCVCVCECVEGYQNFGDNFKKNFQTATGFTLLIRAHGTCAK